MAMRPMSILIFMCLASINACSIAATQSLPTRQECIVKVLSLAPAQTRFDSDGLKGLVATAANIHVPLAGLAVRGPSVAYLQFSRMCTRRFDMARRVMSTRYHGTDFRIEHDLVVPGPQTINMFGDAWRDGRMSWPPPARQRNGNNPHEDN